jgi:hypothetical protein
MPIAALIELFVVPADGTSAANLKKRRLRYASVLRALGQAKRLVCMLSLRLRSAVSEQICSL